LPRAMVEKGVNEGAVGISRSGMDDHAMGFVDDDEVVRPRGGRKGECLER
jgi:hypothetical protein